MISKDTTISLYQSISEANEERLYKEWHASAMASCPRAHYFKRLGLKTLAKPTAAKMLRWQAGHSIEGVIRPHIEKLYKGVGSNERMTSKKMQMTGEFDNYAKDEKRLIEIKSVSDYAFWGEGDELGLKEKIGTKPGKWKEVNAYGIKQTPYLHHEIQQHAYVLLLKELGEEVEAIDYIYISLNGRIVAYKTEVKPELIEAVERRLKVLNDAWAAQEPPECVCKEDNPLWGAVLQYCDYRDESNNKCCDLSLIKEK